MTALIAAGTSAARDAVVRAVRRTDKFDTVTVASPAAALKAASGKRYELIVIESRGEEWLRAAGTLAAGFESGVILLARPSEADNAAALEERGVTVLYRPLSERELAAAVRAVCAADVRIAGLRHRTTDLSRRMEDIRIVTRAKLVLMETLGYTEAQAHRCIEKKGMDERVPMRAAAGDILRTYEN